MKMLLAIAFAIASVLALAEPPAPLLKEGGKPVNWWFVFKLNAASFPGCGGGGDPKTFSCPFDKAGTHRTTAFGQQFIFASDQNPKFSPGSGCAGGTSNDPIGATFAQVYNGSFFYVIWNDQPKGHPKIPACGGPDCNIPWGHSKGMLAWDASGDGFVMQVTTPSWPESGSKGHPRADDSNTLGCVFSSDPKRTDNNVILSQHFFALALKKSQLLNVLDALENASVGTDPNLPQLVNNGGPADVQKAVLALGKRTPAQANGILKFDMSNGITLYSKPSALHIPPWQMVSSLLDGAPLKTATFWGAPQIPSTLKSSSVTCWPKDPLLKVKPGPVKIVTSGEWDGKEINLGSGGNHAKIGVSTLGKQYVIFGDMNQQGALTGDEKNCARSQNGRGGLFFVLEDQPELAKDVAALIDGDIAPTKLPKPPAKKKK